MTGNFFAHVRQVPGGNWEEHALEKHLRDVAGMAGEFGRVFGSSDWAFLAGLWHDLGKYKPDFQTYIRSASGYEAHLEGVSGKVDHSTAGAIHAIQRHPQIGKMLAYLIAGHHSGLPDWYKADAEGRGLEKRLQETRHLEEMKKADIPTEILSGPLPMSRPPPDPEHAHLWIRMLFSCLVDADFLDTEAFMDPEKPLLRGAGTSLESLQAQFNSKMAVRDSAIMAKGEFDSPVNRIRREVFEDCLAAAERAPGFFSLTVPTGGGKTLSSIAFALKHGLLHGKRRIILVIPFTSIIEQSAKVLSDIFGPEIVLEHHSNFDLDRETPRGRLAAENWDAPIVVTTNVQLFESLFASRTSRCRRLHNLADSILILDEAQMLPPEFLAPTLSVLKGLVGHFGCSVVLSTATQPALVGKIGSQSAAFPGLDASSVREIVKDPMRLTSALRRVSLRFLGAGRLGWSELAKRLSEHDQVLCIVNRRRDCRALWEALKSITTEVPVHLSALMCGEHRSGVIRTIKAALVQGENIRVISTQLIEAGVDIDFPVVYRAMTGLDGIAQAAGRCNREGRLQGKLGETVVFNPPEGSPPGLLRKREQAGAEVLRNLPDADRLMSPEGFDMYFRCLYRDVNDFGWDSFKRYLTKDVGSGQFQFRSAARWFKLIDEAGMKSIIVWYVSKSFSSLELLEEVRRLGPSRTRMRGLQRASVSVPERVWGLLRDQGSIAELEGPEGRMGLWAQCVPDLYDPIFGLKMEGPELSGQEFIC